MKAGRIARVFGWILVVALVALLGIGFDEKDSTLVAVVGLLLLLLLRLATGKWTIATSVSLLLVGFLWLLFGVNHPHKDVPIVPAAFVLAGLALAVVLRLRSENK